MPDHATSSSDTTSTTAARRRLRQVFDSSTFTYGSRRTSYRPSLDSTVQELQRDTQKPTSKMKASSLRKNRSSTSAYTPPYDEYLAIHPRIPGVFTPQLPPELWIHILRFATAQDEDFCPYVYKRSSYASSAPSTSGSFTSSSSSGSTLPTTTHTFLTHTPAHTHLPERIARYNAHLAFRASLTRVCRVWNTVAQEVLFEQVWISSGRDGRRMAERLGGDRGVVETTRVWATTATVTATASTAKRRSSSVRKWWLKSKTPKPQPSQQSTKVSQKRSFSTVDEPTSSSPSTSSSLNPGRFIRHLRIETASMDKCSPHDLLLILQHCGPLLDIFEDYRSVRRPMHPLIVSGSEVVPFGVHRPHEAVPPQTLSQVLSTDAVAQAVLSRPLKRLTWTNYAHESDVTAVADFSRGVRLYEEVVAPLLGRAGSKLEVLEVVGCVEGIGMRSERVNDGDREREVRRRKSAAARGLVLPSLALNSAMGAAGMLTELTTELTTTDLDIEFPPPSLHLPSLRSLKATLSNSTFTVLSTWCLPVLRNLSVISADFGYAAEGFRLFFEVHGAKIEQLELGHSSGEIQEFWVTEPPPPLILNVTNAAANGNGQGTQHPQQRFQIPLDAWCPNLIEFICSADAQWNWQSPDWIAPHVLLPAHAGLRFIGVRDMERRLVGDADEARRRERYGGAGAAGEHQEDPYFMLLEQFGSLLRKDAFPCLRYVRDMSVESDVMRRSGKMAASPSSSSSSSSPTASSFPHSPLTTTTSSILSPRRLLSKASLAHLSSSAAYYPAQVQAHAERMAAEDAEARGQGQKVLRFWMAVVDRCRERGVWLEDWRGVNVTMGELRRAGVGHNI